MHGKIILVLVGLTFTCTTILNAQNPEEDSNVPDKAWHWDLDAQIAGGIAGSSYKIGGGVSLDLLSNRLTLSSGIHFSGYADEASAQGILTSTMPVQDPNTHIVHDVEYTKEKLAVSMKYFSNSVLIPFSAHFHLSRRRWYELKLMIGFGYLIPLTGGTADVNETYTKFSFNPNNPYDPTQNGDSLSRYSTSLNTLVHLQETGMFLYAWSFGIKRDFGSFGIKIESNVAFKDLFSKPLNELPGASKFVPDTYGNFFAYSYEMSPRDFNLTGFMTPTYFGVYARFPMK